MSKFGEFTDVPVFIVPDRFDLNHCSKFHSVDHKGVATFAGSVHGNAHSGGAIKIGPDGNVHKQDGNWTSVVSNNGTWLCPDSSKMYHGDEVYAYPDYKGRTHHVKVADARIPAAPFKNQHHYNTSISNISGSAH